MSKHLWQGTWRGRIPLGDIHNRARTIVRPTGGIVRGKFPSRKNGRMVQHEGLLELDAIYLFEASPLIARYREQPTTIRYPDGNLLRRYTPDFELLLTSGEVVMVEIKPFSRLCADEVRHKFERVAEHMNRDGTPFAVLTDLIIRDEPRLANLKWIYHRAARIPPTHSASTMALARHKHTFPVSISTANRLFEGTGTDTYSLLLAGRLKCNLGMALSLNSILTFPTETNHDWFRISQEHGF
jgi:hypothetical protein